MRGEERRQRAMLMIMEPGDRVPKEHPLRRVKELADAALTQLSPLFDVEKIEGDDVEVCAEAAREIDQPGAVLTRTGAVREHQRGAGRALFRRVDERRRRGAGLHRDGEFVRISQWPRAFRRRS